MLTDSSASDPLTVVDSGAKNTSPVRTDFTVSIFTTFVHHSYLIQLKLV